jgi:hypothetical protein
MDQIQFLLETYPMLQHVIAIMVICRVVFKPIFAILGRYVELTVEQEDDKKLHKFMGTKTYKMIVFIVDMLASVKLPAVKKKDK